MTNLEFYKEEILNENKHSYLALGNVMMDIYQKYTGQSKVYADNLIDWLCEEHQILDKEEKEYLSAVIKPFRKRVDYIAKWCCDSAPLDKTFITVRFIDTDTITLPYFNKNTMYKGMELNKKYSLKELGL